ncbi:MAG: hypothetical protein JJU36_12635 [Phycisphaeraceae bacterium]|nr:hypothetical protein [Phycisphaeraceae bacterium]
MFLYHGTTARFLDEALAKGIRPRGDGASNWKKAPTYVGRMLRLTSLAPDIIEAILRGGEPDGLSLEKLRKDLPVRWEEQRAMCRKAR